MSEDRKPGWHRAVAVIERDSLPSVDEHRARKLQAIRENDRRWPVDNDGVETDRHWLLGEVDRLRAIREPRCIECHKCVDNLCCNICDECAREDFDGA